MSTQFSVKAAAITLLSSLALFARGAPAPLVQRAQDPVQMLIAIAPSSGSCDNAPAAGECATASDAVMPLVNGFAKYKITTAPEQAALISWMAFESADFKYNTNHFPGTPGQGTRCMFMPNFVKQYVSSLPELAGQAASASSPADVLKPVLPNEYSFASGSYFYSTQCSAAVKTALQSGSDEGWEQFITGCVQTTVTDERRQYWERAKKAFGM